MKKITYLLSISALFISSQLFAQENTISENGNVGIGTGSTAPTARLTVAGTTRIDSTLTVNDSVVMASSARVGEDLKVEGNLYIPNIPTLTHLADESILVKDPFGLTQAISIQGMAGTIYSLSCDLAGVNPFWNNGPGKIYTECPGVRVGIGTANPEFTLDVRGDAKTTGHLWVNQSLSVGAQMGTFSKLNIVNSNRTAAIQVKTSGNTLPYQRLMYFEYDNPDTKIMEVHNTATNQTAMELRADGQMDLYNGVANIFHFGTNGMFSVSNNTQKTFVVEASGLTRARKIKVDADVWADYVFEPTYKLMPLSEVESFLKEHKHLPSIPSEKVMKEEGIDIAEMNVKMMEKIEELTLYLIEQNKELEKVKAELETLKQQKP
ncbi:hypothetical protein [Fluviicola chungangensis]|uniref:BZIP transcription factor n=1 Tax=Fluviicola chungangensis TaxID=2597671 RepID=A0A556MY23_9FLAO|nr:hypothetical protein [Fluviicola chungangensis]TSJ44824.1 hypothetical protein FO442_09495 [Fluviicola chungangensis]